MKKSDKQFLNSLTSFNGIYLSGFYIRNQATVTALSLLFEKVHLPNQLELVISFAKTHSINLENKLSKVHFKIENSDGSQDDPFGGLNDVERLTAQKYLYISNAFCMHNHELFPTVFTTDMLKKSKPLDVILLKKGQHGEMNTYSVTLSPQLVSLNCLHEIESKLDDGFVPIIGQEKLYNYSSSLLKNNKAIASILAMKSIEMLLPSFKDAEPSDVLEAREKLKDFLPPFWTSMLKLSTDTKKIIKDSSTTKEAILECQNIVDTLVRPALVDIITKMEKENHSWFHKIISPVANTVKMFIGNSTLSPAELVKASLAIATDITADYIHSKQKIEDLKRESGLTFLLEVHKNLKK
jgi:hypothetical protein